MSQRQPTVSLPSRVDPEAVGAAAGFVAGSGSPGVTLAAMDGPLLGGCWLLGGGLVLDGLFD